MPEKLVFKELTENNWTAVLLKLRETEKDPSKGGCALFLGPEALISKFRSGKNDSYLSMLDLLCERALKKINDDPSVKIKFHGNKPSLFSIREFFMATYRGDAEMLWKQIFEEVYSIDNLHPVFYEKLPFIPIPFIINTSPDLLVKHIFQNKAGIDRTQFSHYDYRSNSSQKTEENKLREPTLDSPIVYNLFGTVDFPKSVVSSPRILLEYVFSMLSRGQDEIDSLIYNNIKLANYFIFLGFDFESWHLKLLLRFFDIKSSDDKVAYARPGNLEKEETMNYFKELFNITFVKYNIIDFIEELYRKCSEDKIIKLRQSTEQIPTTPLILEKENLYTLLKNNKVPECLEILEKYFKRNRNNDMIKKCIGFIASYRDIKNGVFTSEEIQVKMTKITEDVTEIVNVL